MAGMSMAEMLQSLQDEKEEKDGSGTSKGAEKVVNVVIGKPIDGTIVTVDDEQYIAAEDADAKRPKPVPKSNRRGNKELMAELDRTKELAEGNKEKYQRLMAEFDNARARSEKENSKMFDYGAKDTLEKLLPIVDDFERALENVPENEKGAFSDGIEMVDAESLTKMADGMYDIQGRKIKNGQAGLKPGIYIHIHNGSAKKVLIK